MGSIEVVRATEISAGPESEGIRRTLGQVGERVTLGRASMAPQTVSNWHHHGEHTTYVYVLQGPMHLEWGPGGRESAELAGGDFYVMSPETIHRESNPGADEQVLIGFHVGSGVEVVNVDGPEPDEAAARKSA